MNAVQDFVLSVQASAQDSPLNTLAVLAAAVALATTPIAFALLARMPWFQARRGRVLQRPSFPAVVSGVMLTMAIPAILLALIVKSQYFDRDRYEFDPNRIPSVLDQGRQFELRSRLDSVQKADRAVRAEMKRLADERKALMDSVKKLDQSMITLAEAALRTQATSDALGSTVQALGGVRKAIGVDAEPRWQELVAILNDPARRLQLVQVAAVPAAVVGGSSTPALSLGTFEPELSSVPAAQQSLARLLPLNEVPEGWAVGDLTGKHLETFNAENLYEKINGRAESFLQYSVTGMAYAYFQPRDNPTEGEVQLYIYEFLNPLKAFGKFGSERPPDVQPLDIGTEAYLDAGSVAFHQDKYFVQVVSTSNDPVFASFSEAVARQVADRINTVVTGVTTTPPAASSASVAVQPEAASVASPASSADPTLFLKLLPKDPNRDQPQYVAQDVFGYSFLSDVFLAGYNQDNHSWQAFLRSYKSPAEARATFDQYLETAQADGATIEQHEVAGVDAFAVCSNPAIGLHDVIFLKGNTLAGVNGSTDVAPAEAFARSFAQQIPATLPVLDHGDANATPPPSHAGYDDN